MKPKICPHYFLIVLLLLGGLHEAKCQDSNLSQANVQYLYDLNAPFRFDSRIAMGANEATVFLRIQANDNTGEAPDINYIVKSDYKSEDIIHQATLDNDHLIKQEDHVYFYQFSLPVTEASHYIFLYVHKPIDGIDTEFRYDIPLETEASFPLTDLVIMRENEDIPVFKDYLEQDEAFRIVSVYQQAPTSFLYFYSHNFAPNPPPMAVRGSEAPQNLTIDSLFSITLSETIQFDQPGLYFVQTDTTSLSGISFRICDKYYPRLVTAEELIEPLRYISTSEEMERLEESEAKKEALDRYWMKIARSQEKAKLIIRDYYRQVTAANRLFTTYKEGWKTGQGMVLTLYGVPDQVFRENNREVWVYQADRNLIDLSFSFVKVKNIYTDEHYNLVPDEDYKKFWFRNIDLWRKGVKSL